MLLICRVSRCLWKIFSALCMGAVTDTACNSQLEDSWYYLLGIAETTGYCRHSVMALSEPWYWICLPVDVLFCFGFFFTKIHTIFYCNDAIIQKWLPISFKINLDLKVKFKLVPFKISQRYFKYLELFMFYISNVTQNLTLYLYHYVRSGDVTLPAHTLLGLSTVNCLLSNL